MFDFSHEKQQLALIGEPNTASKENSILFRRKDILTTDMFQAGKVVGNIPLLVDGILRFLAKQFVDFALNFDPVVVIDPGVPIFD